jgi:acetyl esterase/lipase
MAVISFRLSEELMKRCITVFVPVLLIASASASPCQDKGAQVAANLQPQPGKVQSIVYKSITKTDLKMAIHFPEDWKKGDRRPAIVFFFGGGWNQGKITQFERQAEYLAGRGMVAARADYRVKSRHDVTPLECVQDAKSAMYFLRKNAAALGIDPERIVAAGGSAGGHIAACTAIPRTSEEMSPGEDPGVSTQPNALVLFNPVLKFEGVPELTKRLPDPKYATRVSPTLHLGKDSPPAVLFYGKEDRLLAQGEEYLARAKAKGSRAELMLADGVGHGFFNKTPWLERTLVRADEFLQSLGYLKGKATLKAP